MKKLCFAVFHRFYLLFAFLFISLPARSQTALELNGWSQYAMVGPGWETASRDFTVELWFMRTGEGKHASIARNSIIPLAARGCEEASGPSGINYIIGIDEEDRVVAGFTESQNSLHPELPHLFHSANGVEMNTWYHVAFAVRRTENGQQALLMLNGRIESDVSLPGIKVFSEGNHKLGFGTSLDAQGQPNGFFQGRLDEIRLWKYARQVAEVKAVMTRPADYQTGLKGCWSFDEADGDTCYNFPASLPGNHHRLDAVTVGGATRATGTDFQSDGMQKPQFGLDQTTVDGPGSCMAGRKKLPVTVTDQDEEIVEVRYFGRKKGGEPAQPFTIIGLPDTQYYTQNTGGNLISHFYRQTEWIRAATDSLNIVFVAHLGDCVENGDAHEDEWLRADTAMRKVEVSQPLFPDGLPYGISVGNHDQTVGNVPGLAIKYNEYFGEARFAGRDYYGGHYGKDNNNHFQVFKAGHLDFIALSLEFRLNPDAQILDWADSLLSAYPHHKAMVYSHFLLEARGNFASLGKAVYNRLRKHPNFFLMMSGHVPAPMAHRTDYFQGKPTHSLLVDFQSYPEGGQGYLNILTFYPEEQLIRVSTYSPSLDQHLSGPEFEFTLPFESSWQYLGSAMAASGKTAEITWEDLLPNTQYEWYASLSDGHQSVRTEDLSFSLSAIPEVTTSLLLSDCSPIEVTLPGAASYETLLAPNIPDPSIQLEGEGMHTFFERDANGCIVEKNLLLASVPCDLADLVLFPNPAPHKLQARWPSDNGGMGWLRVWNLHGQLVHKSPVATSASESELETSYWLRGSYVLELELPSRTYRKRFSVF